MNDKYGEKREGLLDELDSGMKFVLAHREKPEIKAFIRRCKAGDLEDILGLQTRVYTTISDKNTFVKTTEEELAESLVSDVCIGAYHLNTLIGFTLMVVNPLSPRNLGAYLEYSRQQCAKCVTYDTTFVDTAYKGYGLQRVFVRLKDKIAVDMGSFEALATVSPENGFSLNNLRASGFMIAGKKRMYGGYDRYILRKPLNTYKR
jgi:hypothetical protein